jgi:hypothetical protein
MPAHSLHFFITRNEFIQKCIQLRFIRKESAAFPTFGQAIGTKMTKIEADIA